MTEPSTELMVAQVEMALEERDGATARRMYDLAVQRCGPLPELKALERRIALLESQSPGFAVPPTPAPQQQPPRPAPPANTIPAQPPNIAPMAAPSHPGASTSPAPPPPPLANTQAPPPPAPNIPAPNTPAPNVPAPAAAADGEVDELIRQAQHSIREAEYDSALEILERARTLRPEDGRIPGLVEQAHKAAQRHAEARHRQEAGVQATREIEELIRGGKLTEARNRFDRARAELGHQPRFDELEAKLVAALEGSKKTDAEKHLQEARQKLLADDVSGALAELGRCLDLEPENAEAQALRERLKARAGEAEGRRQQNEDVQKVVDHVERLMASGQLVRADERLRQGMDQLGQQEVFDSLAETIDAAKKERDFRQRIEWAERRANEAEDLLEEAARVSFGSDFAAAIELLERAQKLDPSHPEIEGKLETARTAFERQRKQETDAQAQRQALDVIAGYLDALRLDAADLALKRVEERFGTSGRLEALRHRLDGLRQAESGAGLLPTPDSLGKLGIAARQAVQYQERSLASAYSWRDAFLYPFRGPGPAWLGLLAVLATAEMLAPTFVPSLAAPPAALVLPLVIPLLALWVAPALARATLDGGNQPPSLVALVRPRNLGDGSGLLAWALVFGLPLWALVLGRPLVPLLDAESAPWGWLVGTLLAWGLSAFGVAALAVGVAFGAGRAWRLDRHFRGLGLGGSVSLLAANLLCLLAVGTLYTRAAHLDAIPFVVGPGLALFQAYGLVLVPHLAALALRRRRLEWAEAYA
jgi:tetratricopeptide (TPR) repeat protein